MTAADWRTTSDPLAMLTFLLKDKRATDRQFRLFACACCRRIWDRFPDDRNRALVAVVEDHPNGTFADPEIHAAAVASSACEPEAREQPAFWVAKYLGRGFYKMSAGHSALHVATKVLFLAAPHDGYDTEDNIFRMQYGGAGPRLPRDLPAGRRAEAAALAGLVREVFGDPLSPTFLDPDWRTGTVVALAEQMYESRDFSLMPILGDALLDAGCDDEQVLEHCRKPTEHYRGCHVIDSVLGKS